MAHARSLLFSRVCGDGLGWGALRVYIVYRTQSLVVCPLNCFFSYVREQGKGESSLFSGGLVLNVCTELTCEMYFFQVPETRDSSFKLFKIPFVHVFTSGEVHVVLE